MSHKRYAKLAIKNLNKSLAEAALREIAKVHGGEVQGLSIRWGRYAYFTVASSPEGLRWEYDDFSAPISFEKFQKLFLQHYNATAIQMALKAMGRPVQVAQREGRIYIRAGGWPN